MKTLILMLFLAAPVSASPTFDDQRKTKLMTVAADESQPVAKRVGALKELRMWAPYDAGVNGILEGLMRDQDVPLAVRVRSAQSLGRAITLPAKYYEDSLSVLLDHARDASAPLALRAMCVKALHWATESQAWVKDEILGWTAPGQPLELREAALWALESAKPPVEAELLAVLKDKSQAHRLRHQALKSLYPSAAVEAVRNAATWVRNDVSENAEMRETARLFLLDNAGRRDLWLFFRLRHEPVTYNLIEVLELE